MQITVIEEFWKKNLQFQTAYTMYTHSQLACFVINAALNVIIKCTKRKIWDYFCLNFGRFDSFCLSKL